MGVCFNRNESRVQSYSCLLYTSREREQEIKRLAEHNEQFRNELTGYENSQVNVSVM